MHVPTEALELRKQLAAAFAASNRQDIKEALRNLDLCISRVEKMDSMRALKVLLPKAMDKARALLDTAAENRMKEIKKGAVVQKKSGGPAMTILDIRRMSGIKQALCEYVKTSGEGLGLMVGKEPLPVVEQKKEWIPLSELKLLTDQGNTA